MAINIYQKLKEKLTTIEKDIYLKNYTTFRIGGKAKYFFVAKTKKDLISALKITKKLKLPFYVLGGGSKLLASDKGFDGLVIKTENSKFKVRDYEIFAEAGLSLERLINIAVDKSLTGIEWAAGIPGTVGGAVRGNAGAWGGSMSDIVKEVKAYNLNNQKILTFPNKKCQFSYRSSIFKKNKNLVILSSKISLKKGNKERSKSQIKKYLDYRKNNHPLNFPSAGSIFENVYIEKKSKKEKIPVGKIIGDCGLAGKRIGNVKISEKHSNFIVNLGNGKAKDVKKLIKLVKEKVKKKFGITLKEELQEL